MRRAFSRDLFRALVSQASQVQTGKQRFSASQQHRSLREMQLIDEPRLKVLTHRGRAATNAYIAAAGCLTGAVERGVDSVSDEVEVRTALHAPHGTRMV